MKIETSLLSAGTTVEYSVDQTPDGPGKYHYVAVVTKNNTTTKYRATLSVLPLQEMGDIGLKDGQILPYRKSGQQPQIDYSKIPNGCKVTFSPEKITQPGVTTAVTVTVSGRGYQEKTQMIGVAMEKYKPIVIARPRTRSITYNTMPEQYKIALASESAEPEPAEGSKDQPETASEEKVLLELDVQVKGPEDEAVSQGSVTILGKTYTLDADGKLEGAASITDDSGNLYYLILTTASELAQNNNVIEVVYEPSQDETVYDKSAASFDSIRPLRKKSTGGNTWPGFWAVHTRKRSAHPWRRAGT